MEVLLPLLSYLIPILGNLLLRIPVVPNKVIPFILGAFNVAHKYWIMAGFPTVLRIGSADSGLSNAGFGFLLQVVPVVWGVAEQYLFHRFYESKKLEARAAGKARHWLESGKATKKRSGKR